MHWLSSFYVDAKFGPSDKVTKRITWTCMTPVINTVWPQKEWRSFGDLKVGTIDEKLRGYQIVYKMWQEWTTAGYWRILLNYRLNGRRLFGRLWRDYWTRRKRVCWGLISYGLRRRRRWWLFHIRLLTIFFRWFTGFDIILKSARSL
jgi:hypothetical protein